MGRSLLHERIEAEQRAYASEMPVQGEKALYKVAIVR
jgi:hypothetical protein